MKCTSCVVLGAIFSIIATIMIGVILSLVSTSCSISIMQSSTYGADDLIEDAQTNSDELDFLPQEGI